MATRSSHLTHFALKPNQWICRKIHGLVYIIEGSFCTFFSSYIPFMPVGFTSVVKGSIFVQGKERGIEQHGVVVLHDNPLVLRLDPWLVLIG